MKIISLIIILIVSIFFTGIVNRTKSLMSGRKGPRIMQPINDILKLLRKDTVYSKTTSTVFRIAPIVYFSSVLMAALVVPLGGNPGIISFEGDFVFFAYILALGKFFNIIMALDTGSSFEGMGASREALFSLIAEPAFFIMIGSLSLLTGYSSFADIFGSIYLGSYISYCIAVMSAIILIVIAMVENSRMPVDDPKTHLELTMIHEVMILDNSGFDLGLILYTTNLKFAVYGALLANLMFSLSDNLMFIIPMFLVIQILFAVLVGIMESFTARFRMNHNSQFIFILTSGAFLIFLGVLLFLDKFA